MINIYDEKIEEIHNLIKEKIAKIYSYSSSKIWSSTEDPELIFKNDTAIELAPGNLEGSVVFSMTTNENVVNGDTISIIGDELSKVSKREISYSRVVLLRLKDEEDKSQDLYNKFKQLERSRYNLYLDGFMLRASTVQKRETIRVSKKALKDGISFEKIGNAMINEFKKIDFVESVNIIFITEEEDLIKKIFTISEGVEKITEALNTMFDGLEVDCHSCSLESLCEEVDGMREIHRNMK